MIGGMDLIFRAEYPVSEVIDLAVRHIIRMWPNAVVEDVASGTVYSSYHDVPFGGMAEAMVYRDRQFFDEWERLGADPSLENTMIHVIGQKKELTLVIDNDNDHEMMRIVKAIGSALRRGAFQPCFQFHAERLAA